MFLINKSSNRSNRSALVLSQKYNSKKYQANLRDYIKQRLQNTTVLNNAALVGTPICTTPRLNADNYQIINTHYLNKFIDLRVSPPLNTVINTTKEIKDQYNTISNSTTNINDKYDSILKNTKNIEDDYNTLILTTNNIKYQYDNLINNISPVVDPASLADSTDSANPQQFTGYNQFNQDLYLQGVLQYNNFINGKNFIISNKNYQGKIILDSNGGTMLSSSIYNTDITTLDSGSPLLNTSGFSAAGLSIKGNYGLNIATYGSGLQDSGNWGFNPVLGADDTEHPSHFNFVSPQQIVYKSDGVSLNSPQYNFYIWNGSSYGIPLAINAEGIQYTKSSQTSSIYPNVATTSINDNGDYALSVTTVDNIGGDVLINGTSWRKTLSDLQTAQQNITELQDKMNYLYKTFFHI